jgi:hypothetical protein
MIFVAPSNGQVPVHGPWTYGDHCGAGSMGSDIDSTDAACHVHDDCYDAIHLTADRPPELSLCLQGGYVWYCGEYGGCLAGQDGNGVGGTQYIPPPAKLATLSAPNNGQVPVHGPWTYGNHCGAGGMGSDINSTDATCHVQLGISVRITCASPF